METVSKVLASHSVEQSKPLIKLLPADKDGEHAYVLIEGDANALRFIGNLLLAHADSQEDCGLQLHPLGAGSINFDERSELGIYIHKQPCMRRHPQ